MIFKTLVFSGAKAILENTCKLRWYGGVEQIIHNQACYRFARACAFGFFGGR